jgi:hypothetical protein
MWCLCAARDIRSVFKRIAFIDFIAVTGDIAFGQPAQHERAGVLDDLLVATGAPRAVVRPWQSRRNRLVTLESGHRREKPTERQHVADDARRTAGARFGLWIVNDYPPHLAFDDEHYFTPTAGLAGQPVALLGLNPAVRLDQDKANGRSSASARRGRHWSRRPAPN